MDVVIWDNVKLFSEKSKMSIHVNFVIIGGGKTLENTKEVRQRVLPGTRTE
jgi:hypothetical protein